MKANMMVWGFVLLSATAVQAQQATPATHPPIAGKVVLGVSTTELEGIALGYRASKLIGAQVYNDHDEKIGKVGDLIIKPDGTISMAIINVGGFLGVGTHHVAIPVGQFTSVKPKLILPGATKDALKQLPPFEYAKS
ncbi:MAG: PRC-barrel domain protein [Myxococcaceae bacterium]|nr:PRC-barrel domain protein [Myxococcaceae bacterium]